MYSVLGNIQEPRFLIEGRSRRDRCSGAWRRSDLDGSLCPSKNSDEDPYRGCHDRAESGEQTSSQNDGQCRDDDLICRSRPCDIFSTLWTECGWWEDYQRKCKEITEYEQEIVKEESGNEDSSDPAYSWVKRVTSGGFIHHVVGRDWTVRVGLMDLDSDKAVYEAGHFEDPIVEGVDYPAADLTDPVDGWMIGCVGGDGFDGSLDVLDGGRTHLRGIGDVIPPGVDLLRPEPRADEM